MRFDIVIVFVVISLTGVAYVFLQGFFRNAIEKICVSVFLATFALYAGVGIGWSSVSNSYVISYMLFLISMVYGLMLGFKVLKKPKVEQVNESIDIILLKIARLGTFVYLVVQLISLVYPENVLGNLFRFYIDIGDIFERRVSYKSDLLSYLLYTVKLLCLPLVYVYLYRMKSAWRCVFLLGLVSYLTIVESGYIGRSGLMRDVIVIVLVFITKRGSNNGGAFTQDMPYDHKMIWQKARRLLAVLAVLVLLLMPLLNEFTYMRVGRASTMNRSEHIYELLRIETGFPLHYEYAEAFSSSFSPWRYFYWILTLPFPKGTSSLSNVMNLNYEFSEMRTGNLFGSLYFHVQLPSLIGEGFLLYGSAFYWVHGIFIGLLIALVIRFLSNSKCMIYWAIYISLTLTLMARGGSQGAISIIVNYSLIIWLVSMYARLFRKRRVAQVSHQGLRYPKGVLNEKH